MILRPLAIGAICLSVANALTPSDIPSDTPVSQLIASANAHLSQGKAQDALTYFDVAIQRDPSNYLTIFKRGATYLSLGKNVQASRDFDQVLALKPGFEGALTQRAKIKARKADWAGAKEDYVAARKQESQDYLDLEEAEGAEKLSADAEKNKDWEGCVTHAGTAILVAGTSLELRQRRARCRFQKGEIHEGIADLQHVVHINPSLTEPYLQMSAMTFFSLGEPEKGTAAISKCLHNDPDNKACLKLRKSEKSIERTLKKMNTFLSKRQYNSASKLLVPQPDDQGLLEDIKVATAEERAAGNIHPNAPAGLYNSLVETTCNAYFEMKNLKKAAPYCTEALTYDPHSLPALLHKASTELDAESYDIAINTLNLAKEHHGATSAINDLLQKAHMELKRSKQKDYYKVLGLDKDADERDIKRAWRKLTIIHHPDKAAKNGVTQEEAQKKMSAINEAYEVLSDPELKARFDRGEDPMDPQSGQGGNPFQGSPFGFGQGGQPIFFQHGGGGGGGGGGAKFKFQAGGDGFPFGGGGFPF
ncbi:unnamed protein product [Zymoseptoria tritici ST99CH_1A5]|uniref:Tetratricopeptide repeat and J domain-containing co-chaperone DNJ1 n=1 Tax=Zymoseptoria tritici ST99CH_1A5 TaxID=1276529 RepID=A0A1Y6LYZ3_ZYMTR|nr:unnamed protein product [Zymoseptoria tritici ST99CH_1A5]